MRHLAVKDYLSIVQTAFTICAIVGAAIWFFMQGEVSAKANISHALRHRQLSKDFTWVHLTISVANTGKRPLNLSRATFRIQKILPLEGSIAADLAGGLEIIAPEKRLVPWPSVGFPEYEDIPIHLSVGPGETDHLDCEFLIPAQVRTVKIYSSFRHPDQPSLGWSKTTIYEVEKKGD